MVYKPTNITGGAHPVCYVRDMVLKLHPAFKGLLNEHLSMYTLM